MLIINNWGTKLHTCGGLQSYNKIKGRSNKNYYNSSNSEKEKVKEEKRTELNSNKNYYNSSNSEKEKIKEQERTELNQEEIELLAKGIYKLTRNIINNIVKNLNK